MFKRYIEVDRKKYTVTYDEERVLDTITLMGDEKLIASNTKIGKKVVANADKIFAKAEVKGLKYVDQLR